MKWRRKTEAALPHSLDRVLGNPSPEEVEQMALEELYDERLYAPANSAIRAIMDARIERLEAWKHPAGTAARTAKWALAVSILSLIMSAGALLT